jgi:2-keto-4-pentenoate hydratase/2-oxohepta-3-ene-1,7-dioic acid hydratase in catechol pathway
MKYATFSLPSDSVLRLGIVRDDHVIDAASFAHAWRGHLPASLLELIQQGTEASEQMRELVAADRSARSHGLSGIRWHAPIPRVPRNVFCLGLNYAAHAQESSRARGREMTVPSVPVIFTKATTAVTGPYDDVPVDRTVTEQVDWEVELGVVLGRSGRNVSASEALGRVFGYTVINDLSARDLQQQHLQWFKGKSLDGFCPMGPVVVTADEFGDPQAKRLQLRVNGATKQDSNTADMIFPVASIIEWLSRGLTLEAGDVIATGTPEGVGLARTPPEFLTEGDIVEAEIEGIGSLRNRILGSDPLHDPTHGV